jgi:hypothetical protein
MTIAETHFKFKLGLDKVDTLATPNFLPEEIDSILNDAQSKYIQQRANGTNFKKESIEETQKRVDDLKDITDNFETSTFIVNSKNKPNGKFVQLPTNYLRALEEEVLVEKLDCRNNTISERIDVVPITHDRYNTVKRDPFHKPDEEEVNRLPFGKISGIGSFELVSAPDVTIKSYFLRYFRVPVKMRYGTQYQTPTTDVDSEFNDQTLTEIIALAIKDTLEKIESQRFNTNQQTLIDLE